MKLTQVAPPSAHSSKDIPPSSELRDLLKVGCAVLLENGMHELIVPATVVDVTEDTFTVQRGKQKTICKFSNAWFTKDGNKLYLGDNEHCYSHVV